MFLAFEDLVPANCALPFLSQEADAVMQLIETASGAGAVGIGGSKGDASSRVDRPRGPDVRGMADLRSLISAEQERHLQTVS